MTAVIINGADRARFEAVDLGAELDRAIGHVEEAIEAGFPDNALCFLSEALLVERVYRREIAGLWCSKCSSPLIDDHREGCSCDLCPDCEAPACVCRFFASGGRARDAERLDLRAVLDEVARLRAVVS